MTKINIVFYANDLTPKNEKINVLGNIENSIDVTEDAGTWISQVSTDKAEYAVVTAIDGDIYCACATEAPTTVGQYLSQGQSATFAVKADLFIWIKANL